MRQTGFRFRTWGGKRARAGRKPRGAQALVPHLPRRILAGARPVHVTMRVVAGLPSLRERVLFGVFESAIARAPLGRARDSFRVVHYSVQNDHVHLIVEADGANALRRGAQGLAIRLARSVNAALARRGRVWADRFHTRELRTPREMRNALVYVLQNARKHRRGWPGGAPFDRFSSARAFDGWRELRARDAVTAIPWLFRARTWLAGAGWRRHGLVSIEEVPRGD